MPKWVLLAALVLQLQTAAAAAVAAAAGEPIVLRDVDFASADAGRRFLDRVVGPARVVALGEPDHGDREYLLLRNSVFRHLVETLGFSAIAVESDFVLGTAVDDYVMGRGELSDELVASVFSFAAPKAWAANRELLEWMRAYNARADGRRKIHFYGLEMLGHVLQAQHPGADRPLRNALQYMMSVDPLAAASFRQRTDGVLAQLVSAPYPSEEDVSTPYDKMGSNQQNALTVAIADVASLFQRRHVEWIAASSTLSYERAYQSALNASALDADFRARGWWVSRSGDRGQRDAMSARNLKWALEREGPQGRVFVFAANAHITTSNLGCPNQRAGARWSSMGEHAKQWLAEEMIAIGSVGGFDVTQCEQAPNCSGLVQLACALSRVNAPVAAIRSLPETSLEASGFDAVVYVRDVTSVAGE